MAEWNPNPSWTPKEQINGGQSFASLDDVSADDFNKIVQNMQYLYTEGGGNNDDNEGGATDLSNYPVGSIYISKKNVSPATLFGGTWAQIKDRFLLAAGSSYAVGSTGGSEKVTLTSEQLPKHSHIVSLNQMTGFVFDSNYVPSNGGLDSAVAVPVEFRYVDTTIDHTDYMGRFCAEDTGSESFDDFIEARGEAHNNMPPYLAVYMWERTA